MRSPEEIIRELEIKRKALNDRLMNSKDVAEANGIERELWALRAAIRYHKGKIAREMRRERSGSVPQEREEPCGSSETNLSG